MVASKESFTSQTCQRELGVIVEQLDLESVSDLPIGVSGLSPQQIRFVGNYLKCGRMAKAARDAGYSEKSSHEIARKLFKKVEVRQFFAYCVKEISKQADQLVARVWERSVIAHSRILDLEAKQDTESGLTKSEDKSLTRYYRIAKEQDTLLAGILGKLPSLNLNISQTAGEGVEQRIHITAGTAMNLARFRQEVIRQAREGEN